MLVEFLAAEELAAVINKKSSAADIDLKLLAPKVLEDELKIYTEDVRALKSFFSLKSYGGAYKLAIIDDAHCLTAEASNALLKLLEEPPPDSVLMLVTHLPGLLLATIASRCEEVKFTPLTEKEIADYLAADKKINMLESQ